MSLKYANTFMNMNIIFFITHIALHKETEILKYQMQQYQTKAKKIHVVPIFHYFYLSRISQILKQKKISSSQVQQKS